LNKIAIFVIGQLAGLLFTADTFTRIEAAVVRWEEKAISGAEKQAGVKAELEVIGIKLSASMVNLAIELAVAELGLS
jgi:hypothetical protein